MKPCVHKWQPENTLPTCHTEWCPVCKQTREMDWAMKASAQIAYRFTSTFGTYHYYNVLRNIEAIIKKHAPTNHGEVGFLYKCGRQLHVGSRIKFGDWVTREERWFIQEMIYSADCVTLVNVIDGHKRYRHFHASDIGAEWRS